MNQLAAMKETLEAASARWKMSETFRRPEKELTLAHAEDMLRRVEADPGGFSPSKLGRWLGWMQAAAVAAGALSLEQCKAINKSHSQDDPGAEYACEPEDPTTRSCTR